MAVTYQLLDYPPTWLTFDDAGVLYQVRYSSWFPFAITFQKSGGGSWGPFVYPAGEQTIPINKNLNKRFADVQSITVVRLTKTRQHTTDIFILDLRRPHRTDALLQGTRLLAHATDAVVG